MCTNIGICAYMFSYILAHDFDHQRRQCTEDCLLALIIEGLYWRKQSLKLDESAAISALRSRSAYCKGRLLKGFI